VNETQRLMTIPGVDITLAILITAAVGDFSHFSNSATSASSICDLNPRIKESRGQLARTGG
jgi:hypothetical protein